MTTQTIAVAKSSSRFQVGGAHYQTRKWVNRVMLFLCGAAAFLAIVPLIWIVAYVTQEGGRFLSFDFFTQLPTPVGVPGGGVFNGIIGSGIVVGIACLLAIPVGIVAAFYAAEHPNTPLGIAMRFGTDVLSGVPSIVMGIFAYAIIVLPQKHFSAWSGGIALAIIMLPIVLRTTEEMLKLVPRNLREGSLALGASEWKTTVQVTLPAAINGVVTGIMLGIARVAGEAAPMIFTAFGNPNMNTDLDQPTATLPHMIYVYAISPYKDWHDKAWTTAFVLIVLVLGLNIAARLFTAWRLKKMGWH
ncbi:MAG: phosphate ABC transporter permease PstA [Chloroflexi bacterium]|nr:phosphate ABC transporter permease PstA [Chloroflexota bacterium]